MSRDELREKKSRDELGRRRAARNDKLRLLSYYVSDVKILLILLLLHHDLPSSSSFSSSTVFSGSGGKE